MSREISLFTDYKQNENRTTNYVGLALKLLYQESPTAFEEFLTLLLGDDVSLGVGPRFHQQVKHKEGVPDLCIFQDPFRIHIETKLTDWHYDEQLKRHIEDLGNEGRRVLLALAAFESESPQEQHLETVKAAEAAGVILRFCSYEQLLETLKKVGASLNPQICQTFGELERYLDSSGLLPLWKNQMDVVLCPSTREETLALNAYICPNRGGSYSHRRARFMGLYCGNKTVTHVAEVEAKVSCGPDFTDPKVDWPQGGEFKKQSVLWIARAKDAIQHSLFHEWHINDLKQTGVQLFLFKAGSCVELKQGFVKNTPYGLQGKTYFRDIAKDIPDSSALAHKIDGKSWCEFK